MSDELLRGLLKEFLLTKDPIFYKKYLNFAARSGIEPNYCSCANQTKDCCIYCQEPICQKCSKECCEICNQRECYACEESILMNFDEHNISSKETCYCGKLICSECSVSCNYCSTKLCPQCIPICNNCDY